MREPRGRYLAFLGRISPEKGPDRAIAIARSAGLPLKIAAKVDKADEDYFRVVASMLNEPRVEFIGEINEDEKTEFLGQAAALLFPAQWPEPFGVVMIEAMACGTPVLAFRCGSVPEIVDDGHTGRIVSSVDDAVRALPDVFALDRKAIRARFEERFSVNRMTAEYLKVYHRVIIMRPRSEAALSALAARSLAVNGHSAQAAMAPPPSQTS